MKTVRKIIAVPFFGIGMAFMGIAALILGGQQVEWLQEPKSPPHH